MMKVYHGVTASAGVVVGPVYQVQRQVGGLERILHSPVQEQTLFQAAVLLAKDELQHMRKRADEKDKDIFTFQIQILEDASLMNAIGRNIMAGMCSAEAVEKAGTYYADQIGSLEDEYLRIRSTDILDVSRRVIDILDGRPRHHLAPGKPVILCSDTIYPSDIVLAPKGMILGVITSRGSDLGHAAIIARTMGIPAVVQVGPTLLEEIKNDKLAVLDADEGTVYLEPEETVRMDAERRILAKRQQNKQLSYLRSAACYTQDGTRCLVMGNCSGPDDIAACVEEGADEIGLVRCEGLLLREGLPTEEEQYAFYRDCLAAAKGRRVTVRTFDVQESQLGDRVRKHARNPALSIRGIRTCFINPELFGDQLCALLRAGVAGSLRVMLPMITGVEDWQEAMLFVNRAKAKLRARGVPFQEDLEFGAMIEVPSAALTAEQLPQYGCQFFAIGTNDLTQFTYAADRANPSVRPYYRACGEAVCKLVAMTVRAANEAGITVSICGHTACNPEVIPEYLKLGLRRFSVTCQDILSVKKALMEASAQ